MVKLYAAAAAAALVSCVLHAQEPPNIFDKAAPEVEDALRARVNKFYQAFVDGKFRQADAYVAEDSKDAFFAAEKRRYHACSIAKINFSDNFTKASVVTACDTEYFFAGRQFPVKLPITSLWKLENGDWFWYVIPVSELKYYNSPFGPQKMPPMPKPGEETSPIPHIDPAAAAMEVKTGVKLDRDSVQLDSSKLSSAELHIKNTLPGNVTLIVEASGMPGVNVKVKNQLGPNEEAPVTVTFDPKDPAVTCAACLAHPQEREAGTITIKVQETGQSLPIHVVYSVPRQ